METNNPTTPAPTTAATPASNEKPKPRAPIYESADFVCSCNRMMSRIDFLKKNGIYTGEVICKCPGDNKCPNGGLRIKIQCREVESAELV